MKILFISQLLPLPLDAGPKIRAYYVLRYLAEAGHDVTLLCFTRPSDRAKDVEDLRKICKAVEIIPLIRSRVKDVADGLHSLFSETPFLVLRDQCAVMKQKLHQLTKSKSFDAVHSDQLWMSPYVMGAFEGIRTILDQHNAVFMVPQRLAEYESNWLKKAFLQNEASKLLAFEQATCRAFSHVVWVSEEDRKAVSSVDDGKTVSSIIPIATDPSTYPPVKRSSPFRVTFVGGMHWPPNAEGISWFSQVVWPQVARAVPFSVLTLIGKGAPKKLRTDNLAQIEIAGYVGDLTKYLSETAVFIVPLRSGAGMRVKILDAWSWGLPIVSTSLGAEGINISAGEDLLIADDAPSFADALVRILRDPILASKLSECGRATVEELYDWKKVYPAWDQIYR